MLPPWLQTKPSTFTLNSQGCVIDPTSIEYRVLDASGVQYVAWSAATRLALGYYEATDYVAGVAAAGRRTIEWRMTIAGEGTREWSQAWETQRVPMPHPVYALIADMRDQDITVAQVSDARASMLLLQASIQIDNFTGRLFGARHMRMLLDGRGGHIMQLGEPIIGLAELVVGAESIDSVEQAIDADAYRVYNRHLLGVFAPDDRENPKVEFRNGNVDPYHRAHTTYAGYRSRFTLGRQNIRLDGVFGYTDPDGSPAGCVPRLITQAAVLLAARLSATVGNPSGGVVDPNAWKITEERTRDQAVKYSSVAGGSSTGTGRGNALQGAFTGDPAIDTILAMYCRGPNMSAA